MSETGFRPLHGKRIGLITNQTGRNKAGVSTIDLLASAQSLQLKALFSPEHGIRGIEDSNVADGRDSKTGVPIYSLYGRFRSPQPDQLKDLDVLVFDIQDIGCRFYTYISTLANCMEAAATAGLDFLVLDRINPITGLTISGPVLTEPRSFVACHEIPVRHGMTTGELAQMLNAERKLGVKLEIVRCRGWRRSMWADETGLPWINPSPNMRNLTAATLYPGVGLIEFCNVSVGRGTSTPFEWIGAPWIDAAQLVTSIQAAKIAGLAVYEASFTPDASKYAETNCHGIRFEITNRSEFDPVRLGIHLATALHLQNPQAFDVSPMIKLLGDAPTLDRIRTGKPPSEVFSAWQPDLARFQNRRRSFLLY